MPILRLIPKGEALTQTASGRQKQNLLVYRPIIEEVVNNSTMAGQLEPDPDPALKETAKGIRARLAGVAETLGISLDIHRSGNMVYFWVEEEAAPVQTP